MTSQLVSTLLTTSQAAAYLSISAKSLERYRCEGTGPAYIKTGPGKRARVRYRWPISTPRSAPAVHLDVRLQPSAGLAMATDPKRLRHETARGRIRQWRTHKLRSSGDGGGLAERRCRPPRQACRPHARLRQPDRFHPQRDAVGSHQRLPLQGRHCAICAMPRTPAATS